MNDLIILTPTPRHPKRGYAFNPETDPHETLARICWAFVERTQSLCERDCPTRYHQYCLDCHATAHNARHAAQQRFPPKTEKTVTT